MRYRVNGSAIIRSENAAKPKCQRSKFLDEYIRELQPVGKSFDLGCGKLRYFESISAVSDTVVLVDSEIQLSRSQSLQPFGQTSIRTVVEGSNAADCENLSEFRKGEARFDRGFCLNVLPIIPCEKMRKRTIKAALDNLRSGGQCLFSAHYNNKEYRKLASASGSVPFRDGYLLKSLRGYSFFAILHPLKLAKMVTDAGFEIADERSVNGARYLLAKAA